jgi:hypothetical protein
MHTSREIGVELATRIATIDFAVLVQTRMRRFDINRHLTLVLTLRASLHHFLTGAPLFGLVLCLAAIYYANPLFMTGVSYLTYAFFYLRPLFQERN